MHLYDSATLVAAYQALSPGTVPEVVVGAHGRITAIGRPGRGPVALCEYRAEWGGKSQMHLLPNALDDTAVKYLLPVVHEMNGASAFDETHSMASMLRLVVGAP